jgi:hypothetical protein
MGEVSRFGLMGLGTRDTGKVIEQMEWEDLFMLMVIFMKGSGLMTKHTVMESTSI